MGDYGEGEKVRMVGKGGEVGGGGVVEKVAEGGWEVIEVGEGGW